MKKGIVLRSEKSVDGWQVILKAHELFGKPYFSIVTWNEDLTEKMHVSGTFDFHDAGLMVQLSLDGQAPTVHVCLELDITHVPGPYCSDCDLPVWVLEHITRSGCQGMWICPNCDGVE